MDPPTPTRQGGFFERWILLNLALVLSGLMIVLAISQLYDLHSDWAEWSARTRRLALLGGMLGCFPINVLYLLGSIHLKVKFAWAEHRKFWLYLLAGGVGWTFTILCAAAGKQ